MSELITLFTVFIIVFIIGYFLIRRVPPLLHTPLMSMTNAISGVILLGALLIFKSKTDMVAKILGFCAIIMAVFNLFGGFFITERMLKMFKKKNGK